MTRFAAIIANYRALVRRGIAFLGWNRSMNQIVDPLPTIVQAPRLFDGQIQLGDVTSRRSRSTSCRIRCRSSAPSTTRSPATGRPSFASTGWWTANETARELPSLTAVPSTDGSLELDDVEVRTPAGTRLIDPLDMRLDPGESLVITGTSGSGKTTLLRSLAQLWPFTSGTLRRPQDDTMFLSQLPYMPLGDLRGAISYPAEAGTHSDDAIRAVLDTVSLGHLTSRLDEVADWAQDPLTRRAAAHRVRTCPPRRAEGRLPRRVDIRTRRGSGVRALQCVAYAAAGLHRGKCQPSAQFGAAPQSAARVARRRRLATPADLAPGRVGAGAAAEEGTLAQLGAA